jgi:GMP synthase (glutamine-hydrolysing)
MFQQRRSAIALRHVAFEDLGLLAPIMERTGWNVSFCEAAVDDLTHPSIRTADLLIVLGGPIGVYETESYPFITDEIALIERRLRQGLPTLGICLGAQLMAKALSPTGYAGSASATSHPGQAQTQGERRRRPYLTAARPSGAPISAPAA